MEEASVLARDSASRTGDWPGAAASAAGANPLDISWLNSRKDTVGKDKEAELWAAAREFVEENKVPGERKTEDKPGEGTNGHDSMQVD